MRLSAIEVGSRAATQDRREPMQVEEHERRTGEKGETCDGTARRPPAPVFS
jgi:hypothetical protein